MEKRKHKKGRREREERRVERRYMEKVQCRKKMKEENPRKLFDGLISTMC